jgi:hypothetical protein
MQEYTLEINSHADAFEQSGENATLTFVFLCNADVQNLPQRVTKYVRARAFCAAYIYRSVTQAKKITLRIICCDSESEKTKTLEETPTNAALDKFFARLLASFELNAQNEIERVVKRLPTMKALRFPYRELRAGQNDFMSSAYSAIKHGRTLTACAPTGTGKTVCSLYPAVRAMGEGECEKIFYLTPKREILNFGIIGGATSLPSPTGKLFALKILVDLFNKRIRISSVNRASLLDGLASRCGAAKTMHADLKEKFSRSSVVIEDIADNAFFRYSHFCVPPFIIK